MTRPHFSKGSLYTPKLPYDYLMSKYPWTGWWKLNEANGTNGAYDSSGNNNTGIYGNSNIEYGIPGPITGDTAVALQNAPGGIATPVILHSEIGLTAIAWFQYLPTYWAPALITTGDVYHTSLGMNFLNGWLSGGPLFQAYGYEGASMLALFPPNDNSWYMLALAIGTNGIDFTAKAYINGAVRGSASGPNGTPVTPSTNPFLIGEPYGADSWYIGNVAQVAVGDGLTLTDSDISNLWLAA
jgi:hypothetical protein